MMTLVPKHWFSWDFRLDDSVGMPWGEVAFSCRERGSVTVGGQQYEVSRQGLTGPFILGGPNGERAMAVKESAFRQEFTLTAEGQTYQLKRLFASRGEFGLFVVDTHVGSVGPHGWFTRRAQVRLPEDMPAWVRAFVVWLVLLMWKRDSDAGAVAAASS